MSCLLHVKSPYTAAETLPADQVALLQPQEIDYLVDLDNFEGVQLAIIRAAINNDLTAVGQILMKATDKKDDGEIPGYFDTVTTLLMANFTAAQLEPLLKKLYQNSKNRNATRLLALATLQKILSPTASGELWQKAWLEKETEVWRSSLLMLAWDAREAETLQKIWDGILPTFVQQKDQISARINTLMERLIDAHAPLDFEQVQLYRQKGHWAFDYLDFLSESPDPRAATLLAEQFQASRSYGQQGQFLAAMLKRGLPIEPPLGLADLTAYFDCLPRESQTNQALVLAYLVAPAQQELAQTALFTHLKKERPFEDNRFWYQFLSQTSPFSPELESLLEARTAKLFPTAKGLPTDTHLRNNFLAEHLILLKSYQQTQQTAKAKALETKIWDYGYFNFEGPHYSRVAEDNFFLNCCWQNSPLFRELALPQMREEFEHKSPYAITYFDLLIEQNEQDLFQHFLTAPYDYQISGRQLLKIAQNPAMYQYWQQQVQKAHQKQELATVQKQLTRIFSDFPYYCKKNDFPPEKIDFLLTQIRWLGQQLKPGQKPSSAYVQALVGLGERGDLASLKNTFPSKKKIATYDGEESKLLRDVALAAAKIKQRKP